MKVLTYDTASHIIVLHSNMTQCHVVLGGVTLPKQTFFNLTKDKRNNLLNAAKKEFSRVPLNEALISNIVKTAEISRGSFYQYFDDKEDVFFYLLNEHSKENTASFISSLKKTNGDLFETFTEMFQMMLEKFGDVENKAFFKNAFLNMNHKIEKSFTNNLDQERMNQDFVEVEKLIDKKKLTSTNDYEFKHLFRILMVITFHNVMKNFIKETPVEESLEEFKTEIHLLKKGLYKNEVKS